MAGEKHGNLKILNQVHKELSQDLEKMTPQQREEFFKGTEEIYKGLKKMAKVRQSFTR
ncbi:MAG: hypothetical protein ACRDFB_01335 [Rhabdochlamydiaceae bacterium]